MSANHTQPHYAPASVGGLMDPAFLRGAMGDADAHHHPMAADPSARWSRLRQAVLAAARWRLTRRLG